MGERTGIEWCDATVNFWIGCTKVSAACDHCYAEALAARFGLATWGHGAPRVRTRSAVATAFKLDRKAAKRGVRLKVFSNSMSDFFDAEVPDEWRDEAMAVMALTPNLDWLVLTKRPKVMRGYMAERWQGTPAQRIAGMEIPAGGETGRRSQIEDACEPFLDTLGLADPAKDELWTEDGKCRAMQWGWPLANVWLGVTAENQAMADLRVPELLATPAAKRFVSVEPMLGAIDVIPYLFIYTHADDAILIDGAPAGDLAADGKPVLPFNDPATTRPEDIACPRLDWVIAGGESGPQARPVHPDWARALRDQCTAAAVPFFFKQWGGWKDGSDYQHPVREHRIVYSDGRSGPFTEQYAREQDRDGLHNGFSPTVMARVGKALAGRLLDGREWSEMPV